MWFEVYEINTRGKKSRITLVEAVDIESATEEAARLLQIRVGSKVSVHPEVSNDKSYASVTSGDVNLKAGNPKGYRVNLIYHVRPQLNWHLTELGAMWSVGGTTSPIQPPTENEDGVTVTIVPVDWVSYYLDSLGLSYQDHNIREAIREYSF